MNLLFCFNVDFEFFYGHFDLTHHDTERWLRGIVRNIAANDLKVVKESLMVLAIKLQKRGHSVGPTRARVLGGESVRKFTCADQIF